MSDKFWDMLVERKIEEYYYSFYCFSAKLGKNIVSGLCLFGTSSTLYFWAQTGSHHLLWSIVIILLQILATFQPLIPFDDRYHAASYIYQDLRDLNLDIDLAWSSFTEETTESEFKDLYGSFQQRYTSIIDRFSDESTFPWRVSRWNKAQKNAEKEIRHKYKIYN